MTWSEDRLHRWLARFPRARVLAGSAMHDAAVLRIGGERLATCVDQTVEGVHYRRGAPPERIGAKAVARAVSDLAAVGAEPIAVLLALTAGREKDERWMRGVIAGARERARALGAALVGGDIGSARGPAVAAVTALGRITYEGRTPGRDRARAGDAVLLTGPVGGSPLGRHLAIEPRLAPGRWLAERGAPALMDVSDGLALDLSRIAAASGVAIELCHVPIHADAARLARRTGRSARAHALGDGEDHELIACVPPARLERVLAEAPRRCAELTLVGRVTRGRGLWIWDEAAESPRRWTRRSRSSGTGGGGIQGG